MKIVHDDGKNDATEFLARLEAIQSPSTGLVVGQHIPQLFQV